MAQNNAIFKKRAEKAPLIKAESQSSFGFTFAIKGRAFQQGYLFLNNEMQSIFPSSYKMQTITFLDEDNIKHYAVYHKVRGYMVCLTFNEWWERNRVKEGDMVSIQLEEPSTLTYRLKLLRDKRHLKLVKDQAKAKPAVAELVITSSSHGSIMHDNDNISLLRKLVTNEFSSLDELELLKDGEELVMKVPDQELLSLDCCFGITCYKHQIDTAKKVIFDLNGRALLADEVGLGKTIEAGLILKEYLLRGMAKKILILTPASLITQWQEELRIKFDLNFKNHTEISSWESEDLVIASLDTAKSFKNSNEIKQLNYDLLIVDEAHKLKNRKTKNWKFVNSIKSKYLLMLTATPIQNDMMELFNLIGILKEGHLSTLANYKEEFLADNNKRMPKNPAKLREILSEVMIRHRRADTLIKFPKRFVHTYSVELSPEEKALYDELSRFVRSKYASLPTQKNPRGINRLLLVLLQKLMGSSVYALSKTLAKMAASNNYKDDFDETLQRLLKMADKVTASNKTDALFEILEQFDEKVIIFTQFRGTQEYLAQELKNKGFSVALFNGQMSQSEKDSCIASFKEEKQILLTTESCGEGRNLQFCRVMVNYDLPWNPMKIEQRIGRIHRLGQTRDVHIVNLSAKDTIEGYVLELLDKKINLFELIIGELEMILGNLNSKKTLEQTIIEIVTMSSDNDSMKRKFNTLGNKLEKALKLHNEITEAQEDIFHG